jgi:hypothetical protein
LGRIIPSDFHIFQRGWNHQQENDTFLNRRPTKSTNGWRNDVTLLLFLIEKMRTLLFTVKKVTSCRNELRCDALLGWMTTSD